MTINIRTKGADGERQLATELNNIVNSCYLAEGLPMPLKPLVQRNQNQSAVGGKDLIGTYGYAIEVKRQEALSVNSWWKQCVASALELDEVPVLIFRQNKQSWRCVTYAFIPVSATASIRVRAEIPIDEFYVLFKAKCMASIRTAPAEARQEGLFG